MQWTAVFKQCHRNNHRGPDVHNIWICGRARSCLQYFTDYDHLYGDTGRNGTKHHPEFEHRSCCAALTVCDSVTTVNSPVNSMHAPSRPSRDQIRCDDAYELA